MDMGFVLAENSPPILVWRDFASQEECQCLIEAGDVLLESIEGETDKALCRALKRDGVSYGFPGFRRVHRIDGSGMLRAEFDVSGDGTIPDEGCNLLARFEDTIAKLTDTPPHTDEYSCALTRTRASCEDDSDDLVYGLHVDTIGDEQRRFATALLYLTDLKEDECGQTVFPVAGAPPEAVVDAAIELLDSGVECTRHVFTSEEDVDDSDALYTSQRRCSETLEARASEVLAQHASSSDDFVGSALALRPRRGSLVVFFTRGTNGMIDPLTWHGSASVRGEAVKWTLQTCKAVPEEEDVVSYAAKRASTLLSLGSFSRHLNLSTMD
eukprot:TRINITY_DN38495_c0_g1_i1.p1 TRINITY_DN38495_c0_g1~~TRINITY_DN38495_c0_g1_i1.p1  ORF type:complete len:326 (+),score=47.79 TRINITY_DN38495_c0_g1_i1:53-1030(+)